MEVYLSAAYMAYTTRPLSRVARPLPRQSDDFQPATSADYALVSLTNARREAHTVWQRRKRFPLRGILYHSSQLHA